MPIHQPQGAPEVPGTPTIEVTAVMLRPSETLHLAVKFKARRIGRIDAHRLAFPKIDPPAGQESRTTASTCKRTRAPRSSVTCAPGTVSVRVSAAPGSAVKCPILPELTLVGGGSVDDPACAILFQRK